MNKLIKKMWENRGYSEEFLRSIEECNHELPSNIDALCQRLKHYHDTGEQVVLLTDFDMDGIMSGVLGYAGLAELGFNVHLHMPDVTAYGIDKEEIKEIRSECPDAKAILTADVGINEFEPIEVAGKLGFEVLVTDHHLPAGNALPKASFLRRPAMIS